MRYFQKISIFFVLLLVACSGQQSSEFLVDKAGLLTTQARFRITEYHRTLLKDLDIHFKLVILDQSPTSIDAMASELFTEYALGSKTRGTKGVLLLIDPHGTKVRIEIGYDLESIFPDSFVGYLERKQMEPFFRAGKVGAGVEATVELLVTRAQRASLGFKFDPKEEFGNDIGFFSGGAGAKATIEIGTGVVQKQKSNLAGEFGPQPSPELALEAYKKVLRLHIKDPNLVLYTPATRNFFSRWVVTDAQQSNELEHLESGKPAKLFISGSRSVIRFPVRDRTHSPFFFQHNPDGWMLDFATMNRTIIFNHRNYWHFKVKDHEYMFGFEDLIFDRNGFPHNR
jgi:hypothetical protein